VVVSGKGNVVLIKVRNGSDMMFVGVKFNSSCIQSSLQFSAAQATAAVQQPKVNYKSNALDSAKHKLSHW